MREKLVGIVIGLAIAGAALAMFGFKGEAAQERELTGRYQLFDRVSSWHNDGTPATSEMFMIDTFTGDLWRYDGGGMNKIRVTR